MNDTLLAEIRAVLDAWDLDGDDASPNAVREFRRQLEAILDREPGREEPVRCSVKVGDDDRQCAKQAGHEDEHFAFGTNATAPAPRTLLGRTVPDHVTWNEGNGYLCVECHYECHHGDGGAWGSCGHEDFPADAKWLAPFLRAHGHVVEHQPAQDSEPRVFFPGDTVPAEVATAVVGERMDGEGRHVFVMHEAGWPWRATHTSVELLRPSPDEFDAIVDRARNARDDAASASPVAKETGEEGNHER